MAASRWPRVGWAGWAAGLWLAAAAVLAVLGILPFWVPTVYGLASLGAFAAFAADKAQAGTGGRRVSERTLHVLSAAGGWPGALVAQRQFRHKTRKPRFQVIFWLIVLAHVGLGLGWAYGRWG
ncbi:MAG TPA: DUF1294 domain-containing protein [Gemmataceae bacterium]|nr:DUF1294 domain-containing protein [Gemmataceae bacterium]